jgi:hypothetical protein
LQFDELFKNAFSLWSSLMHVNSHYQYEISYAAFSSF